MRLLEAHEVIRYLLDRRMVSPSDIVRRDVSVETVERKNISFIVRAARTPIILKRPRIIGDTGIRQEAAVYAGLTAARNGAGAAWSVPRFLFYDPEREVLATQYLEGATTVRDLHVRDARSPVRIGTAVGSALAALHAPETIGAIASELRGSATAWALSLLEPTIELLATESAATIDIVRRVQAEPAFCAAIERSQEAWTIDALCHNDVRLDNLLVPAGRGAAPVTLVDWELCEPGWAEWDVACFLAGYVELWGTWASMRGHAGPGAAAALPARRRITFHQPLLRGFWTAYRSRRSDADPTTALRVANLVAVRLIQSALEFSQQQNEITRESLLLLDLAGQFAARPLECWVHLLGLPIGPQTGRVVVDRERPDD